MATDGKQLLRQAIKGGSASQAFRCDKLQADAHIWACAQNLHTVGDTVGNVAFLAGGLSSNSLPESKRYLGRVIDKLQDDYVTREIAASLRNLHRSGAFQYLSALVNLGKHRYLIGPSVAGEFVYPLRYGLRVERFEYKGKTYQERWAEQITETYRGQITREVLKSGNVLNSWLRAQAGED